MKETVFNNIYDLYLDLWSNISIGYEIDSNQIKKIWEQIQLYELFENNALNNEEYLKIKNSYGMWM